jgi:excisionase family DNA binding protein
MERRYCSVKECAEALGLSTATVNRRLRDKSIPSQKLGYRVLIPIAFIEGLVSADPTRKA